MNGNNSTDKTSLIPMLIDPLLVYVIEKRTKETPVEDVESDEVVPYRTVGVGYGQGLLWAAVEAV